MLSSSGSGISLLPFLFTLLLLAPSSVASEKQKLCDQRIAVDLEERSRYGAMSGTYNVVVIGAGEINFGEFLNKSERSWIESTDNCLFLRLLLL